jgi:hypothetical protein
MKLLSTLEGFMEDLVPPISFGAIGIVFVTYLTLPDFPQAASEVVGYFRIFFYSTAFVIGLAITTMMILLVTLFEGRITTSYLDQDNQDG